MNEHEMSLLSAGHGFLEAPRWHEGSLWVSDFFRHHVIRVSDDGAVDKVLDVENAPSGLGFLTDGSTLIVSQRDKKVLRLFPDGSVREHADLSQVAGGNANDMLVLGNGHAYVGNFGYDTKNEQPRTTHLAHVQPDGTVTAVPDDVYFPNGMGVLPDGVTLVLCETAAHKISAFDIASNGDLTNYRVWAEVPDDVNPDGLAVDTDGGVWFGNAAAPDQGSGFFRVEEGGTITDTIPCSDSWSVACAFGGKDKDVLYLLCNDTTPDRFRAGDSRGTIRVAHVGRAGA